ncbi:MAG: Na+/H+ antiporter subunit E [Cryobacterium sp.]|nr:Na+/H+ antiporter subunit E [Cryobacterium sp.]
MAEATRKEVGRRLWRQLPLLIALVALWMSLWGQITWFSALTGIIVAITVTRVFYLPPVDLSGRFNIWYAAVFFVHFIRDVVFASFQVAFQAITPNVPRSSIIAIQLRTRSDLIMTLDAIAMSLVPGSLVVDVDRERSILYLHTFDTESADDVEAMRRQGLIVEARIVRAIGSHDDLRAIGHVDRRRVDPQERKDDTAKKGARA